MFSLKFGRTLNFFFFLVQGVVNLMGLALLKEKKSKRRENHGTKVKVKTSCERV